MRISAWPRSSGILASSQSDEYGSRRCENLCVYLPDLCFTCLYMTSVIPNTEEEPGKYIYASKYVFELLYHQREDWFTDCLE